MTMLDYIKQKFPIGTKIYLYIEGSEVVGRIEQIGGDYIIIEGANGQLIGMHADGITAFSTHSLRKPTPQTATQQGTPSYVEERSSRALQQKDLQRQQTLHNESIELLEQFLCQEHDQDNETLQPMGSINQLRNGFQFGFIDDCEDGERYYFNISELIDSRLIDHEEEDIPVVYYRTQNKRGKVARGIHLPGTIKELLQEVRQWIIQGEYHYAWQILENIGRQIPDLSVPSQIKANLQQLSPRGKGNKRAVQAEEEEKNALYNEARSLMQYKNYDQALKLYRTCIQQQIKSENSIKDTIQIFITLYVNEAVPAIKRQIHDEAIAFIEEHKSFLPDEMSTLFSLENAYFALGEYPQHIEIAERIVALSAEREELDRYVFYLNKLAQSYFRNGEYDKAIDAARQGLEVAPSNAHLLKTMQTIEEGQA